MAIFLYKVGCFSFRRRGAVLLLWLAVLAAVGGAALSSSATASNSFTMPGTESQKAFDLLEERFPGSTANGATARVVFQAPDGDVSDAADRGTVERVLSEVSSGSVNVASIADPYVAGAVSQDGSVAYAVVNYTVESAEMGSADRAALEHAAEVGEEAGLIVEVGGNAMDEQPGFSVTEIIGVAIAAVVLLVTFGSLVAAGLPLLTAIVGVGISLASITALTGPLELSSTTLTLALMLGLAVGIDYALFIVTRYRAERAEGRAPEEAVGRAAGTAGSAVVFAGLTVVIALAGLAVVNIPLLTEMGLAASGAVALAVLVALTLIPAMLGFAGDRVLSRKDREERRGRGVTAFEAANAAAGDDRGEGRALGVRWARFVLRRPVTVLLACVLGLGAIAIPALDMQLGLPDDGSKPSSSTQRQAYDLLAEGFGPGFNGPLTVVVDARGSADPQQVAEEVGATVSGLDDVAAVTPATFNEAGDTAVLTVIPDSKPSSADTEDLVNAIRDATGDEVLVTGTTAVNIDMSQQVGDALMPYLFLVVGLAFLLLMVVFRSVLVPLKAALGFLLSVVASLGAVVAVFQWGWAAELVGLEETGPVMSMMPILLVGIVFGLAMDYEVFLVSRMREAHVHGEAPRQAIVTGFRYSARVVAAAAVIMISVFAGFVGTPEPIIKTIGFGLAIAVLFDAFVVRMAIVPAVLALLDRAAWWLPRWLDRALPNVDIEGERLHQALDGGGDSTGPDEARRDQSESEPSAV
ncbi:MMPL family transporter [Streptomyces sp. 8K308]|uniref:MMPL family transporter n=1 Tax=Streptomyces sp. 8K308 TaxID=2530388 RepID=UPI001049A138|nr:MMPL family transporter [Streptomyces sp. 8K308]TDC18271.1 MMPL family transporter [Streptomyces sp. 8K308]